jgi:hypothetical protein
MSRDGLFGNLLKIAGAGALLYVAYKLGEHHANQNMSVGSDKNVQPVIDAPAVEVTNNEEEYIMGLIRELRSKPNKTKSDRDNIELLQIKLKQLKIQK